MVKEKAKWNTFNVELIIEEMDDNNNEDDEEEISSADNNLVISKVGIYILKE